MYIYTIVDIMEASIEEVLQVEVLGGTWRPTAVHRKIKVFECQVLCLLSSVFVGAISFAAERLLFPSHLIPSSKMPGAC